MYNIRNSEGGAEKSVLSQTHQVIDVNFRTTSLPSLMPALPHVIPFLLSLLRPLLILLDPNPTLGWHWIPPKADREESTPVQVGFLEGT